jgi:hypothetical protein
MPTLTTSVVERFPEHEMTIERLARSDDIFGSICEDHTVGVEALRDGNRVMIQGKRSGLPSFGSHWPNWRRRSCGPSKMPSLADAS